MPTTTLTVRGKEYLVTHHPIDPQNEGIATPYRLTPANGRGKTLRLIRNRPRPELMFSVPEDGFTAGSVGQIWVRETAPGELVRAC